MNEQTVSQEQLDEWIVDLADSDADTRIKSRERLVAAGGHEVARILVETLLDPRKELRLESALALKAIRDPIAAPALLNAMDDEDEGVRWCAAEGLVALGRVGVKTVLNGIISRARSTEFCKSAHHVLQNVKIDEVEEAIAPVRKALKQSEPAISAPGAAYHALVAMHELPG